MPRSLIFGREIQYSDTFHCSKPALNGLWKTDTKFAKCRQLPGGADQRKKAGMAPDYLYRINQGEHGCKDHYNLARWRSPRR
jgi:hypothetical protein